MKQITPFNPEIREIAEYIKVHAPVKNLTEDEILTTLRLMKIRSFLSDGRYNQIVVHKNDKRLELCDDKDKFLALLADCDARYVLLFSGRCRQIFGGTVYHWRKIARQCPITSVASAISECGSGYYGRGWEIAPHIERLIQWIDKNMK